MANVIKTVLTYPLDGSNRDFIIPFEYLARKFVVVTLIGVDRKVLTINTDYRFATRTTISLTKAWGPADGYTTIELRRVTSTTDRLVDFTDGSILRAYDLNVAQIQTMHVAEEARDLTADTIGVNNDGHLDARGRRIVNLANAVDDRDAVPLGQLKTMNQSSWQARNEALQFRNDAEGFRNDAERFMNAASASSTSANSAKDAAHQSNVEAYQHRLAAESAKSAAQQSNVESFTWSNKSKEYAESASVDAAKAEQQADRAKQEADKLQDYNNLVPDVQRLDASVNELKRLTTNMDFEAGFLTSFRGTNERSQLGLRVGGDWLGFKYNPDRDVLTLEGWKQSGGVGMPELGAKSSYFPGYVHTPATHITSQAGTTGVQGLHLQWNAPGQPEPGYSVISNNKGGGANGGFIFRSLDGVGSDSGNNWRMGGDGGGFFINGTNPVCQVRNIRTGIAANYDSNGSIYGDTWKNYGGDGWLINFLTSGRAVSSCTSVYPRLRMWDSIGTDWLSFMIDVTSCGVRWFVSDERHKENIQAIEDAEEITKIIREYKAVSYKFRDWSMGGKSSRFGYTAQDLQRLWPEAVSVMENAEDAIGETTLLPDHNEMIGGIMLMLKSLDARLQRVEARMPTTNLSSSAKYARFAIEPTTNLSSSAKDVRYDIEPADLSEGFEEYDAADIEAKLKKFHETVASVRKEETK